MRNTANLTPQNTRTTQLKVELQHILDRFLIFFYHFQFVSICKFNAINFSPAEVSSGQQFLSEETTTKYNKYFCPNIILKKQQLSNRNHNQTKQILLSKYHFEKQQLSKRNYNQIKYKYFCPNIILRHNSYQKETTTKQNKYFVQISF